MQRQLQRVKDTIGSAEELQAKARQAEELIDLAFAKVNEYAGKGAAYLTRLSDSLHDLISSFSTAW